MLHLNNFERSVNKVANNGVPERTALYCTNERYLLAEATPKILHDLHFFSLLPGERFRKKNVVSRLAKESRCCVKSNEEENKERKRAFISLANTREKQLARSSFMKEFSEPTKWRRGAEKGAFSPFRIMCPRAKTQSPDSIFLIFLFLAAQRSCHPRRSRANMDGGWPRFYILGGGAPANTCATQMRPYNLWCKIVQSVRRDRKKRLSKVNVT